MNKPIKDTDPQETKDWLDSFEAVYQASGSKRSVFLLKKLLEETHKKGLSVPQARNTPYINTIPKDLEKPYPGDGSMERRIRSLVRWNAMAMVVRANERFAGIGGHISTYASAATLYEVAFNHFLKGKDQGFGDQVFFQGHASPGIYARAFLEGRLSQTHLENFRRELAEGGGLASYPHPRLMPEFWEFPTVSMGLGPLNAIYQARFNRYLEARGITETKDSKVWAFLGDGETDEPEALGSLSIAARENLDNLIFVINCNLQRLDGPVRGNGKIIQELEAIFRGAGWMVIKVLWGENWDPLLEADTSGKLITRMNEAVDGDYQKYSVTDGAYAREHFFGKYPETLKLVEHLSDKEIQRLPRGGHDQIKMYNAYRAAVENTQGPTVILAKTIKGYGLGEAGEGRNITHAQKKLNAEELKKFRDRFDIPIPDNKLLELPFYRPDPKSEEITYLQERRHALGGYLPKRKFKTKKLKTPGIENFDYLLKGTGDKTLATTMAFNYFLQKLLKDKEIGNRVVPIIPDEARTFGLDPLFRSVGIYSSLGQLYEPVDQESFLYYREAKNGQVLEEGITEAGSMASFIAAGSSYATFSEPMIPFYIYYSMFGYQRTGDLMWSFGDIMGKGFLLGATFGRSTLPGEGLQHQDGHSHLLMSVLPNVKAYHPAFAYEIAVILCAGLKEMYTENQDCFYYMTLQNELYPMPAMPEGAEEGILKGLYLFEKTKHKKKKHIHLWASDALIREAIKAKNILEEQHQVSTDLWSATSYQQLRKEALAIEEENINKDKNEKKLSYLEKILKENPEPIVAVSDQIKAVPGQVARWTGKQMTVLGTDGFGLSDTREALREHFNIDAKAIVERALIKLDNFV